MKCHRCGKENPAEVHTCSFLALLLADELYRRGSTKTPRTVADELVRMHNEIGALREALAEERRVRLLGQEPDVHWESLRDIRRACYAKTDAALTKGEKK
jgi:hypothetical protein